MPTTSPWMWVPEYHFNNLKILFRRTFIITHLHIGWDHAQHLRIIAWLISFKTKTSVPVHNATSYISLSMSKAMTSDDKPISCKRNSEFIVFCSAGRIWCIEIPCWKLWFQVMCWPSGPASAKVVMVGGALAGNAFSWVLHCYWMGYGHGM
jgi:hypothetical protein